MFLIERSMGEKKKRNGQYSLFFGNKTLLLILLIWTNMLDFYTV